MDGFNKRLRKYRKLSKLTQEECASYVGMSRTGYADLEKDGGGKVFEKLPQIARTFGCRIDDLFPEMDEKSASADAFDAEDMEGWER